MNKNISVLCSCTDLERTASCIAFAGHAWAVPVSDMRGVLRALYEVTIMPVFIAVYTYRSLAIKRTARL